MLRNPQLSDPGRVPRVYERTLSSHGGDYSRLNLTLYYQYCVSYGQSKCISPSAAVDQVSLYRPVNYTRSSLCINKYVLEDNYINHYLFQNLSLALLLNFIILCSRVPGGHIP